jgi:hypothetical protein
MHERGLIFSVYQTAKDVLHSDDTFERRCRARTKLEGFNQTMSNVLLSKAPLQLLSLVIPAQNEEGCIA